MLFAHLRHSPLRCSILRRRLLKASGFHPNLQRVYVPDSQHQGMPPRMLLMATQNIGKGSELLL